MEWIVRGQISLDNVQVCFYHVAGMCVGMWILVHLGRLVHHIGMQHLVPHVHVHYAYGAHHVVGKTIFVHQRYLVPPAIVVLGNVDSGWPVLSAHHPDELVHFGQHDDDVHVLLPDHLPKVAHSVLVRPLRNDVGFGPEKTLFHPQEVS